MSLMGFLNPSPPAPLDPNKVADAQMSGVNRAYQLNAQYGRVNQTGPFGSTTWATDPNGGPSTMTQTLDPRLQGLFNQQWDTQGQRMTGESSALNQANANAASGFNPTGLSPLVGGVQGTQQTTHVDPSQLWDGYSRDGFEAIPGANDFTQERQNAEDALYGRATSRLDPEYAQRQTALDSSLRNKGFQAGDEGADAAQGNFDRAKNDAYGQARDTAIAGGSAEQDRLLANALRIRNQQNTEGQQDVTNANTAGLQGFGMGLSNAGLNNSANAQTFGQGTTNANLSNSAHGQGFGEQVAQFQMPFQTANTLSQGSTPMVPQFGNGTTNASPDGAPNMAALYGQQYNGQLNQYNADQSKANGAIGAIGGLATGALTGTGAGGAMAGMVRGAFGGGTNGGFGGAGNSPGLFGGSLNGGGGADDGQMDFSGIQNGQVNGDPGGLGADSSNMDFSNLYGNGGGSPFDPSGMTFNPADMGNFYDPSAFYDPSQFDMSGWF